MVHFYNSAVAAAAVTSVVLSSLAPGVQAAPAMPPLPMRQEARRSMLKSGYVFDSLSTGGDRNLN